MTRNVLLEVKGLETTFFTDDGAVRAIDNVSFHIHEGEILGVVGESGCGKSVTSLSIMGLVPSPPGKITGGEILLHNRDLTKLTDKEMRTVRESAEKRILGKIGELKAVKTKNPDVVIIVAGCMAQKDGEKLQKKHPQVDLLLGCYMLMKRKDIVYDRSFTLGIGCCRRN